MQPDNDLVVMGRISGIYGVSGWVRIRSYTRPRNNIFNYSPWYLRQQGEWTVIKLVQGSVQGKGLIASLQNVSDRESARALINTDIAVARTQLPELPAGEFYWCDLIGLTVINQQGVNLGQVVELYETGANDVLAVSGAEQILIPLVMGIYVLDVDKVTGQIRVDWQQEDS